MGTVGVRFVLAFAMAITSLAACNPRVERVGHVTKDYVGKAVELRGKANDGKGGAVVVVDEVVIYVRGLPAWPKELAQKWVVVRGTLSEQQYLPEGGLNDKGEWTQGVTDNAKQLVITPGDYELDVVRNQGAK